ncbi:MAG: hypothetical protein CM1200mP29_15890 [Verrucomicrobiota bacterium]|nr:MAG: hypothetical protein CM1200mP29_15890 [Verrucomicrobiota bacterium]
MANNDFDIHYVANLARMLCLRSRRLGLLLNSENILGYVKKLEELDVTGVEPMAHAVPLANVLRPTRCSRRSRRKPPWPTRPNRPTACSWCPRSSSDAA